MEGGKFTKIGDSDATESLYLGDDNNSNQNIINPYEQYNSTFE
jgi:hypothetical protein